MGKQPEGMTPAEQRFYERFVRSGLETVEEPANEDQPDQDTEDGR